SILVPQAGCHCTPEGCESRGRRHFVDGLARRVGRREPLLICLIYSDGLDAIAPRPRSMAEMTCLDISSGLPLQPPGPDFDGVSRGPCHLATNRSGVLAVSHLIGACATA